MAKAKGFKCGLSIIEPKGEVAQFAVDMAREMGIHAYHLDPARDDSHQINLMKGPTDDVAEATIAVLKGMFGKQEAFFQLIQELTARNFIKLLKTNHGDKLDIISVLSALRDNNVLNREIGILAKSGKSPELLSFFQNEMLGKTGDKWKDLALGLRAQIENIVSNESLRRVITGDSGIDLDKHMAEGGILAINSALGKLRRSGDAFGQFMAMHLQSATFRRPGSERTRVPHYLIIDEKSRYINPDTERFLSIAAEYRTAAIFAVQSFSQLELDSGTLSAKAMKTAILSSCRNKICFGGVTYEDAEYFANELGKDWGVTRQNTYDGFIVADFFPKTYRDTEQEQYRIRPTDIQDGLPRFHFIHKLIRDGQAQKPGIAVGEFVPQNWQELIKPTEPKGLFSIFSLFKKGETPKQAEAPVESVYEAPQEEPVVPEEPAHELHQEKGGEETKEKSESSLKSGSEKPQTNDSLNQESSSLPARDSKMPKKKPVIKVNQRKEPKDLRQMNNDFI
jgi:hypothetical protein